MNAVDYGVLLILAIMVLGGWYRGAVSSLLSTAATLLSWGASMLLLGSVSTLIKSNQPFYQMLLYYTEGSEYVSNTAVELVRVNINSVSLDQLTLICKNADLPLPMEKLILRNVAMEVFAGDGVVTLGEYFNRTIVSAVINIFALLMLCTLIRLAVGFLLSCFEHGRGGYRALTDSDGLIGGGVGLLHGIVVVQLVFLLLPVVLTVLPGIYSFISESFFGEIFYRANPFISMIPGT